MKVKHRMIQITTDLMIKLLAQEELVTNPFLGFRHKQIFGRERF